MAKEVESNLVLNDRMSSVIRDIHHALDGCIDAMEQMERTGSAAFDPSTLRDLRQAADHAGRELDEMAEAERSAGESAEESSKKHEKLAGVMKSIGAAAAAGAAVAGAAAFKLGKDVVEAYADYEQLIGGVETLFKGAAPEVQKYANEAFKTAGLSANNYMETVTGFSASLIQSLGGDTAKAAEYANMAVTDMSDNANKMGTDMSSIQNAYQGFAKQNYTMLDNLKLGYGGTKEEMQRLLEDAEKLSGKDFDISSYADIVDAIHVIQTEMDITGTTAKEAEQTISGSIGMLKGAYENLLAGLGNPEAEIDKLANDVVQSLELVFNNITPVIENLISVLPTAAGVILDAIGGLLPSVLGTITSLFDSVLTALIGMLPQLGKTVSSAAVLVVTSLAGALPSLLTAVLSVLQSVLDALTASLPTLVPLAVEAVVTVAQGLVDNLPMILDAALQLILALADGLLAALPDLIAALPEIITGIVDFLIGAIPMIIDAGVQLLGALIDNSGAIITAIVSALPAIISGLVNGIISHLGEILGAGLQLFVGLKMALPMIVMQIITSIPEMVRNMIQTFLNFIGGFKDAGAQLLKGLWNGISDTVGWVIDRIKGIGSRILSGIKSVLGIHSPSKETAWMGEMLGRGLADGITASSHFAEEATRAMSDDVLRAAGDMNATAQIGAEFTGVTGSSFTQGGGVYGSFPAAPAPQANGGATITINIDMSGMQNTIASGNDVDDLVTQLANGLRSKLTTAVQGVC